MDPELPSLNAPPTSVGNVSWTMGLKIFQTCEWKHWTRKAGQMTEKQLPYRVVEHVQSPTAPRGNRN